ncbi:GNAT family N-acetyltransferase [Methylocystis bryophila]|uniref:BioF2-like acetyltransferase domain-containing protein n=1 Tax=Methylocystis bryophila TaxID=655015 RepID=A0A1W6MYZ6_9HYPH|nr:GNAT family N-acetyltransferase [Methylocystis bryophila]ARN82802.1 hypothetical protein B1812_18800 [Methylocystis bryophila]BDV39048.1 hypothetical protein DSM21852_23010 [Methylocystis bryophila]
MCGYDASSGVTASSVSRDAALVSEASVRKFGDLLAGERFGGLREETLLGMAELASVGSAPAAPAEYRPIFFDPHCPSEKYYGWRCLHEEPGLRILRKQLGIFSKILFLCQNVDDERLSQLVKDRRFGGPTIIQIVHDFSRPASPAGVSLGGRHFEHCQNDRTLNIGTLLIELDKPEEELWKNFDPNSRTKVRRAAKEGVQVRISARRHEEDLRSFFDFYRPLAKRANLDVPSQPLVERMIDAGDMISAAAVASDSTVVAVNLIYLCPPYAYDVWGASSNNRINGAGHLLRWEGIKWLQNRDFRWYDLGGAATTDPSDPIYSFKKTLGGRYVSLGSEYRRMDALTTVAYAGFRLTKKLTRQMSPLRR